MTTVARFSQIRNSEMVRIC